MGLMLLFHGLWSLLMTCLSLLRHLMSWLWFWPSRGNFQRPCFYSFSIVNDEVSAVTPAGQYLQTGIKGERIVRRAWVNFHLMCVKTVWQNQPQTLPCCFFHAFSLIPDWKCSNNPKHFCYFLNFHKLGDVFDMPAVHLCAKARNELALQNERRNYGQMLPCSLNLEHHGNSTSKLPQRLSGATGIINHFWNGKFSF